VTRSACICTCCLLNYKIVKELCIHRLLVTDDFPAAQFAIFRSVNREVVLAFVFPHTVYNVHQYHSSFTQ